MRGPWLGLLLAVAASVALNGSFVLQHAGSVGGPPITPRRPLATLRALLGSPAWAAGAVLGLAGWALCVGALAHAPLSLVQAFMAGGVVLTIPMAVAGLGHRVVRMEALAVVGGLAVFGEPLGRTPAPAAAHAAGFPLVVLAGSALAPAQAAVSAPATSA